MKFKEHVVNETDTQEVFHVVSQKTHRELFRQVVSANWFLLELIARSAWVAAINVLELRGLSLHSHVESITSDEGRVMHWMVTLVENGQTRYCCRWPVSVLETTAVEVARQWLSWLGDGRVQYWVGVESKPEPSSAVAAGIHFDSQDSRQVLVPPITMRVNHR